MSSDVRPIQERRHLISVVIVNYNGLKFLQQCLDAVSRIAFSKYDFEIVVVDNASSDGSQALLREWPGVTYIESPVNTGFTGGNNLAAKAAKGDILLLLNNDTQVETSLDPMVDELLRPGVGAVGCRLHYGDGRLQFSSGHEHTALRIACSWFGVEKWAWLPKIFRRLETDPAFYDADHSQVDWVSGAALMTWTHLWQQIGGMDESFFMYCEDVDYCRNLRLAGQSVRYTRASSITHYEGAGKVWIGPNALQRTARSYVIYVNKHFGALRSRLMAGALGSTFILRAAVFSAMAILRRLPVDRGAVLKEKGTAFLQSGKSLLRCAISGQQPELP